MNDPRTDRGTTPNDEPRSETDALVDAYLDGQLDAAEEQRVRDMIDTNPDIAKRVELQERVDDSLRRLFGERDAPENLQQFLSAAAAEELAATRPAPSKLRERLTLAGAAIAAGVAWFAVFGQLPFGKEDPYEVRDLVAVYQDCVDAGFKPKWVCEDEAEFAETFEERQGVPLRLAALPDGRRMVGLAYLDGLSPDATSMLAYADGEPVVVLVTALAEDPGAFVGGREGLRAIRTEKFGLAFYEVTPFDEPLITPFLEQAELR